MPHQKPRGNGHLGPKFGPKPRILRGFQGIAPEKLEENGHIGPTFGKNPVIYGVSGHT